MPNEAERPRLVPRRVSVERDGPVLIEGPVEVVAEDGTVARSDRFAVALCTCRRSRTYPWCDTSHRGRKRPPVAGAGRRGRRPLPEEGADGDRDEERKSDHGGDDH
ncbi:CDGSH iron-sulfur domain-containing protein [Streptomyces sp. NPDC010273]|uniref:CDGSH iron-sulfur domain-containing protein n=1 Tax=Streptomyces sp. NPDC010273 TaxID=3364829 RepID=UPI0036EBEB73